MIALLMRLTGLSRGFTIAALVSLAVLGLGVAKCRYDRGVIAAHEAQVGAQVQASAAAAATTAAQAVTTTRTEVEQANVQARDAAARSPDPLRAGLDRLRTETGPANRPDTRRPDDLRR